MLPRLRTPLATSLRFVSLEETFLIVLVAVMRSVDGGGGVCEEEAAMARNSAKKFGEKERSYLTLERTPRQTYMHKNGRRTDGRMEQMDG